MSPIAPNRQFCTRRDCLIITCSKHFRHISKRFKKRFDWDDYSVGCGMYKSGMMWKYQPPDKDYVEEEAEDLIEDTEDYE